MAAVADPFTGFDIYETFGWCGGCEPDGWATFGGTSLSSPVVAGLWGLAGGPQKGVGSPAKTLYANFKKHKGTYDVTTGRPPEGATPTRRVAARASRGSTPTRTPSGPG